MAKDCSPLSIGHPEPVWVVKRGGSAVCGQADWVSAVRAGGFPALVIVHQGPLNLRLEETFEAVSKSIVRCGH